MATVLKIATKKIWGLWVAIFFTTRFDGNKRIFFLAWPIFQEIFSNAFYSYSKNRTTSLLTWQKKIEHNQKKHQNNALSQRAITCSKSTDNSFYATAQLKFTCSKSTIKTLEKGVKYVQS